MIEEVIAHVKEALRDAEAGHDWFHIERVRRNALHIHQHEGGNKLVIELAALLHDIADSKFHGGDDTIGPRKAREVMERLGFDASIINEVIFIIENISFKGGRDIPSRRTIELDIVQDADRLDAIGAIGIARAFNYGGYKGRALFDPAIPPDMNMTKEEYKKSTAPTLNHFYEKLFLLKDLMNTKTGRTLANERHQFMQQFVEQFLREARGMED
ncbi:MAG: HD domain-containing protein [Flavobacteriales bacterium]|jgi:uncharacterized protein